jgi:DNA-binding response OmpR family regulator
MVLVITDNKQFSIQLTQWFEKNGYEYSLAGNGQEAIEQAAEVFPTVVVLDLYLKDSDAIKILCRIREQGYKGPVILLAGPSMRAMIPEAYHLGVDQVIGQSLKIGQLTCAIRSALGSVSSVHVPESLREYEKLQVC